MRHITIQTRQAQARNAANAWRIQYAAPDGWRYNDKAAVYAQLAALESPTPDAVNAIIGNSTWTDCRCDHCDRLVEQVALLGESPVYLCEDCLRAALHAFEQPTEKGVK